jgi:hypothetical protein
MHLNLRAKLAAFAVSAAFLAQPALAVAVCWQMGSTVASCGAPCPMEEKSPPPVKAEAKVPGCCAISSAEPAPLTSLVASSGVVGTAVPAPISSAGLSVPPATLAPLPPDALPPAPVSSLFLLHCVLLI